MENNIYCKECIKKKYDQTRTNSSPESNSNMIQWSALIILALRCLGYIVKKIFYLALMLFPNLC